MLFPVLIIIALLIGAFSLATMIASSEGTTRKTAQPLVFLNERFSLWSLVLFLFCPTLSSPSKSRYLAPVNHPH